MLGALLAALGATVLAVADRWLAAIAAGRIARRVQVASAAPARPRVQITGGPFLVQMLGGRYRAIEIVLGACRVGAVELAGLTGRLSEVKAPLRGLADGRTVTAGQVTAIATVPLSALAGRLPAGLALRLEGDNLHITGTFLRMPITGTLGIAADSRQITFTPKITGIPAPVGFALELPSLPGGLEITATRLTEAGLEVSAAGTNVRLRARR